MSESSSFFALGMGEQTSSPSVQAKVFAAASAIGLLVELVGEIAMSGLIPSDNKTLRVRFWARYAVTAACVVLVSFVGYTVVNTLAHAGWNKLAWGMSIVPTVAIVAVAISLQCINTVLENSAGVGFTKMIGAAFRAKGQCKKKCARDTNEREEERGEEFV